MINSIFRVIIFGCSTIFISFNNFAQKTTFPAIDAIVAQVGDNIILISDIEKLKKNFKQNNMSVDANSNCIVMEELMYQRLLVNQAKIDSVVVTDEQVNSEMESRLRSFEEKFGSREKMETFYGKSYVQLKQEFFDEIRDRMLAQQVEQTITAEISVSPKEVNAFFNTIPQDSLPYINSRLIFQQIVVYPEITELDRLKAKNELVDIREKVISGRLSMEAAARLYSEDRGSAVQGGTIQGSRGMMVPQFEATAYSLKPGEYSTVFETDFGYHFMKLIERKGDDYVCQHILLTVKFNTDELSRASERMEECYVKLSDGTLTWDQAVLQFSNDKDTKYNKGTIMNPYTGQDSWASDELSQVDPQMFSLTNGLEVNQFTSTNLYADFMTRKEGIRILRLAERTTPHVANMKDDYRAFQSGAENKKREAIIAKWVASKIQNAYLRIDSSYANCQFKYNWIPKTN